MNDQPPESGRHRTLADAQKRLMARRAALRLAREGQSDSPASCDPPCSIEPCAVNSEPCSVFSERCTEEGALSADDWALIADLPPHLGWGSAAITAVLRAAARNRNQSTVNNQQPTIPSVRSHTDKQPTGPADATEDVARPAPAQRVALAPSLGLAILRQKQAAPARLWLLLRAVDAAGRGMVPVAEARRVFTDKESPLRFCGTRQLRNLLAAGDGLFWQVDETNIWLRSAVRVARELGLSRFCGQEVSIPISELTGGIGTVRAHLYAAFHSGRDGAPISRRALARESGIAPRTQRSYDRRSNVRKQKNYASGPRVGSMEAQELAWHHGPAAFTWRDRRREGADRGAHLLAWQIPNSYDGPHAQTGRGRRKRQNKALADLLHKGTAGNDQGRKDVLPARYFADARAASRAYGRSNTAVYWPSAQSGVWHCIWQPDARKDSSNGQA